MKRKDPTPEFVDHVAAAILKEHPEYTKSQAYAIAVRQLQRDGYLKPGTMQLTEKGRERSQVHYGKRRAVDVKKLPSNVPFKNILKRKHAELLKRAQIRYYGQLISRKYGIPSYVGEKIYNIKSILDNMYGNKWSMTEALQYFPELKKLNSVGLKKLYSLMKGIQ